MTLPAGVAPKILKAGEGRYVVIADKARCTFKIVGEETEGRFGLFEYVMLKAGAGASPHIHHQMTELLYVAEGRVEIRLGAERQVAEVGAVVLVPPNTVHGFANARAEPSTLLVMFCPADHREGYFEGLAALTRDGRTPSRAELLDLMRRYDQEPVTG